MSALRAVLDRLNDIEATIERVSRQATGSSPFAFRVALKSLENRRADLREELAEVTRRESVDVCDYRLIPEGQHSRAISGIASALSEFQDLVASVYDSIVNRPKDNFYLTADVWAKTRLDFGFSYAGSLGIVMTIPNERLLLIETELDQAIGVVFELPKLANYAELREISEKYGHATVRKLHEWSKAHRDYVLAAEIKWIRDKEVRKDVFAPPQEMEHICGLIEGTSDEKVDSITVTGQLTAFNVPSRLFTMALSDDVVISGRFHKEFDAAIPRTVLHRFRAELDKHTVVRYASDTPRESWRLKSLIPI